MSEFRDLPSLVYSCFLSIPLRYGAHLLCLFQWAGQLDELVRVPARVLPYPAVLWGFRQGRRVGEVEVEEVVEGVRVTGRRRRFSLGVSIGGQLVYHASSAVSVVRLGFIVRG